MKSKEIAVSQCKGVESPRLRIQRNLTSSSNMEAVSLCVPINGLNGPIEGRHETIMT